MTTDNNLQEVICMEIKRNRGLGLLLMVCLMAVSISSVAFGATKAITSISIRVGTDTQAGEYLNENITVYSNTINEQSGTYAATNSDRYYLRNAEWTSSTRSAMSIGEEPRMRLYLEIEDNDYAFRGTYSSSNISVKGGSFVSARKNSSGSLEVTVRLNGIKGTYNPPFDAGWRDSQLGVAEWTVNERDNKLTSGYYDVYLYRGNSIVKKLEDFQGTSYNFYPYMTKQGTYTYKVRTVPYTESQKKYGQKSGWTESDDIYIDEFHVSDGTGQTDNLNVPVGATGQVGWIWSQNNWYYRYPDGTYQKDAWLKLNEKWYIFDKEVKMLTGWSTKDGLSYFLQDSGEMFVGWLQSGSTWYFLNRASDGVEGAMHVGWLESNGRMYCLGQNGAMLEGWNQVGENWYYFYPGEGSMARDTIIDTFYVDINGVWHK